MGNFFEICRQKRVRKASGWAEWLMVRKREPARMQFTTKYRSNKEGGNLQERVCLRRLNNEPLALAAQDGMCEKGVVDSLWLTLGGTGV